MLTLEVFSEEILIGEQLVVLLSLRILSKNFMTEGQVNTTYFEKCEDKTKPKFCRIL